ncbi:efflux RND transporter periplasmic adaptor subunit [Martelella alba]|uniref:Efflux RND transporter periplasmic adaptor subunit n=1 Tax=Martelella alba TaxID=2590451 RepID=A0ABY2STT5_9HYPH|nr:efflux RND transporter periplasmic adaptor subunit [Martelella alba]TKI08541.1 efflux RND transporter periplasmic adaptor subunit [Martelella alba]
MRINVLSVGVFILLVGCDQHSATTQTPPLPAVTVVTLRTQPVTLFTQLPGRVTAVKTAEVRPQVSGIIQKLLFKEGGQVKAGQPLYQIDPASYQAAYDKALATYTNAAALAKRYRPLAAAHAVSQQSYEDAVASANEAKADLETARVNLDYTRVSAPISGRIGRSLSTEGALVTDGQTSYLTTIQQLNPIYVDVSESSLDLLRLRRALAEGKLQKAGDNAATVKLTLEDGSTYPEQGRLEFSEVTVDEATGSVTMRAAFPNPHNILLPGMFVHASFPQGIQEQGILVPQEAIMHDNSGQPYVYLVKNNNTIAQTTVVTGQMEGDKWLVDKGLKAGDRVVISGLQQVRSGSKVKATEGKADDVPGNNGVSLSMTDPAAQ